ncbi:hypothetical protein JKP88DRAFT_226857 [Tribonema minus]|uniref:Uncharacterized protein n=1 Tax=Tribonema minus TaxID=303371 RepID=A0A836C951_9STRA|nr:hypothetical protein JKP88DRAFT_226857 [Tribonema minus]
MPEPRVADSTWRSGAVTAAHDADSGEPTAGRQSISVGGNRKPTHRTITVQMKCAAVPSLTDMAISKLADHCESITDISCLPEMLAVQLLSEIMRRQKLTFALAKVFMNCGHDDICRAMESLNLFNAVPVGKHAYRRCQRLV